MTFHNQSDFLTENMKWKPLWELCVNPLICILMIKSTSHICIMVTRIGLLFPAPEIHHFEQKMVDTARVHTRPWKSWKKTAASPVREFPWKSIYLGCKYNLNCLFFAVSGPCGTSDFGAYILENSIILAGNVLEFSFQKVCEPCVYTLACLQLLILNMKPFLRLTMLVFKLESVPCVDDLDLPHHETELTWIHTTVTYEPNLDFYGFDNLSVVVQDSTGAYSDVVRLLMTVMERPCIRGKCECKWKAVLTRKFCSTKNDCVTQYLWNDDCHKIVLFVVLARNDGEI